jgi:S-DNA-T family DNA segregation ATPase FtsK/SpoIIIE
MSRAAGIHLVLATGRPGEDVVTPAVRDGLPGRVAFRLPGRGDSERVLGSGSGQAAFLLGRGDLLWRRGGGLLRLQCPLVTQEDLEKDLRIQAVG